MRENLHQKAAEKSLATILDASEKLFVEKGFSGTSIGAIAKEAGINQSLIYHYYENKKDLWRAVKSHIIAKTLGDVHLRKAPAIKSIDELLEHLVTSRLRLYFHNKNLVRMLLWQALEENEDQISGTSDVWLDSWMKEIASLQKRKKLTLKYTPYEVMLSLNATVWAPFLMGPFTGSLEDFCSKKVQELKLTLQQE
jgi:AcrR family transcriptional regulator